MITRDPEAAAAAIRAGRLAALPTETVYGLAADAANPDALRRLYAVKGRPADHPSIVHLAEVADAPGWAADWPPDAQALADAFWPGPLTLVLPAGGRAAPEALGGTGTIGLRVPDHPLTRAAIAATGSGVAAPSANRFGRVSPTTAQHVADDLGGDVDVILDGGPSRVGVESTIVDLTGPAPRVLRPGAITAAMVEAVLERAPGADPSGAPRAPGTLAAHYAPRRPVAVADDAASLVLTADDALIAPAAVLRAIDHPGPAFDAGDDAVDYAARLYALLRDADRSGAARIAVVAPPPGGVGDAVRDRLRRAAAGARDADERT